MNIDESYYVFVDSDKRAFGDNNNFTFRMSPNNYIKSKVKIQLTEIDFPSGLCPITINSKNNKLDLNLLIGGTNYPFSITLSNGFYNNQELAVYIANEISSNTNFIIGASIEVKYDSVLQKNSFRIVSNSSSAIISIYPTGTMNKIVGLPTTTNFNFTTTSYTCPNLCYFRNDPFYYLLCNQIQSSNFASNIGGNRVLAKIRNFASRGNYISQNNADNEFYTYTIENLLNDLSFSVVDKDGTLVELDSNLQYSFVLKITPIN